ncbi:LacI family DNA-binding transcriptional regulator [Bailinhaonella thermotolerans]|uniref:LacI family DNA-binding transcriptional regulator n=1 Tax=Bailinhaonella thermotolerans TaxID=1070861 RepID=A0A3A4B3Y2_9ACTN|nr:LacI family DNA-binding transcriptional regulator [Bailinhaonella thermotolerans]RJL32729.1 LacI family DNA-binding transcriptional regulator [Bailinhaonella thermotolerans]
MADVARMAGVSHQTVSRVLNDHPNVRAETRTRVMEAIDRLGYRRNLAARTLVTRHSRMLGVVSFDTTLYGPASTVYGIEQAARAAGYFISIVSLKSIDRAGVRDAIDYLADHGADGIVVVAPQRSAAAALEDLPPGMPAVAVEGGHAGEVPVVCVDQFTGARLATEHLLALGHRTVWHVSGPPDWLEAEGRVGGWRAALAAAGREAPEPLAGDWSPRSGYEAGRRLAREPDVTAVFVANDQMALGVLRALAEAGVRVPERISVVGFDDIPESAYFSPPLTTVRQDFGAVGRHSIELLLRQMAGGARGGERLVVPPELVVRSSAVRR